MIQQNKISIVENILRIMYSVAVLNLFLMFLFIFNQYDCCSIGKDECIDTVETGDNNMKMNMMVNLVETDPAPDIWSWGLIKDRYLPHLR